MTDLPYQVQVFSNEETLRSIWRRMIWIATLGAVATIAFMWLRKYNVMGDSTSIKMVTALVVSLWAIGPPLWFAYEYNVLITDEDKETLPKRMERFKFAQEVAKSFWLAVATLIVATLFK